MRVQRMTDEFLVASHRVVQVAHGIGNEILASERRRDEKIISSCSIASGRLGRANSSRDRPPSGPRISPRALNREGRARIYLGHGYVLFNVDRSALLRRISLEKVRDFGSMLDVATRRH